MDRTFAVETGQPAQFHCGNALNGDGSGNCKDRACGRRVSFLVSGYCSPCAAKHGINPLIVTPDSVAPAQPQTCDSQDR